MRPTISSSRRPTACARLDAEQLFRGRIQIGETAFQVRGHDGFAQRLHRRHLQRRAAAGGNGGATIAARAAASFSSILPLASARSFFVGITSTPVTSKRRLPLELDGRSS